MSIKCRSCGYINPDNKTICDNCGCNLKYSRIFEKLLENEKNSTDFLFEIDKNHNPQNNENEFFFDSSDEEAIDTSFPDETDEYKPISFPDPVQEKKSKITKQLNDNERNIRKIGEAAALELLEFFVFFILLLFLIKGFFNYFSIPTGEIGKSALITYLFFNIQSYIFTGKRLSFHFIKKTEDKLPSA